PPHPLQPSYWLLLVERHGARELREGHGLHSYCATALPRGIRRDIPMMALSATNERGKSVEFRGRTRRPPHRVSDGEALAKHVTLVRVCYSASRMRARFEAALRWTAD